MTKGITEREPDPRVIYADIIDLPHWRSPTRPHMSLHDRAAQFAPFAALTGFEDMIAEESRDTDMKMEPQESQLEALNRKLNRISDEIASGMHPAVTFTVFVPDEHKAGGRYIDITDTVKKVDPVGRKIILMSTLASSMNKTIDFDHVIDIHIPDKTDNVK